MLKIRSIVKSKKKYYRLNLIVCIFVVMSGVYMIENAYSQPYSASQVISGITFHPPEYRTAGDSDNWATTWGECPDGRAEGCIYTTWGDGNGFHGSGDPYDIGDSGMGVARIEGSPESFVGYDLWGTPRGYRGGKSVGIISVDGVLYMFAGPHSNITAMEESWLQWSNDLGKTWQYSEIFFRYTDGFSKPTFLNFGKNYAGARDNYVYVYGGPDQTQGVSSRATQVNLARVPKTQIKTRSAYEFFTGLDGNGNPLWSSDIGEHQPVFVDADGGIADSPSIIYNAGIGRYIMAKTHRSGSYPPHGGLGIFDAPEPWGPWTTVFYEDSWMGSTKMYFAEFPTKWISQDGLTNWLVFSGYGNYAKDAYQHMKVTLTLSGPADSTPPSIPSSVNPTAVSESQIDISWNASNDPESGISYYKIFRDSTYVGQSSSLSHADTNLFSGVAYSYEISAVNGTGLESSKSAPVVESTFSDTVPPTVTSVTLNGDANSVILVFSEPVYEASASDVANYNINNGITISDASLGADLKTVTLTTSLHSDGITYIITINNIQDLSSPPNTISANSTESYAFVAQLINNLTVSSGKAYEIMQDGLTAGERVYIDRTYSFSSVPGVLEYGTYIKTANDDKSLTDVSFMTFSAGQTVKVYVAYDDRVETKPSWMASFTDTNIDFVTTDATLSLFSKDFSAGTITLGGNEDGSASMYSVVVVPQSGTGDTIAPSPPTGLKKIIYIQ